MIRDRLLTGALNELTPSKNPYDWLGPGLYFFEDDPQRAMMFAQAAAAKPDARYTQRPIANPAVVGAVIRVNNWLDMSTQRGISEFRGALESLRSKGTKLPVNKEAFEGDPELLIRNLDKAVFVEIHRLKRVAADQEFEAVRAPFQQGDPLADTCRFTAHAHVQIALRNMQAILGWFLPSGDRLMKADEFLIAEAALDSLDKLYKLGDR